MQPFWNCGKMATNSHFGTAAANGGRVCRLLLLPAVCGNAGKPAWAREWEKPGEEGEAWGSIWAGMGTDGRQNR